MRILTWFAACVLLVVLAGGVGLVVAFALDETSLLSATIGATMLVASWHGLRRLGPRPEEGDPADHWPTALLVLAAVVVLQLLIHWNPWLLTGWVIFPLWLKLRRRS
jgi:hypothetical protein